MKLQMEQLSVIYDKGERNETVGLPPATFFLELGRPLVLYGQNGCGKTTLLKVLAGVITPSHGTIRRIGNGDSAIINMPWLRTNAAYVRQQPAAGMFSDLTLAENLALLCPEAKLFDPYLPSLTFHERVRLITELVPFYASHRSHRFSELSGGQQQLFAVACVGVARRQLLLFDEPTSALDRTASERTESLLRSVCTNPSVFSLIVSHDLDLASKLGFSARSFHEIVE